ncbi:MAG: hypothetical protein RSD39_06755 [Oscillospiraceae bacterium]
MKIEGAGRAQGEKSAQKHFAVEFCGFYRIYNIGCAAAKHEIILSHVHKIKQTVKRKVGKTSQIRK